MKTKKVKKARSRARREAKALAKLEEDSYANLKDIREQFSNQCLEHDTAIRSSPAIFVMLGPGFESYRAGELLGELIHRSGITREPIRV